MQMFPVVRARTRAHARAPAMEFRIEKNQLLKGLYLASGIADRKSTMPILANVLCRTEGKEHLVCAATDLSVAVMATLPAKIEVSGGLTLGARQFHEIIKGLAGEEVHLRRTEQNRAEIRGGRAEFTLVGIPDREFPKLPSVVEATWSSVDSEVLRDMLAKTAFSVSTDETRQHLAGVLFESDGKVARMVSTDGHRLSKVGRELPGGPILDRGVLIPRKGVAEIRRVLEGRQGPSEIAFHQGHFLLRADEIVLTVKLNDGHFPPYDQVIPKENDKSITVRRSELLDAFRRVSIMASDKTMGVRLGLDKGRLSIEADNPDLGNARERLEVSYKGNPVEVGFNAKYFIDLLAEISTPEVKVELAGQLDPAVVRPADGSDYLGVIMPMRL
jgi:DNA polymerase-3 subunit beta